VKTRRYSEARDFSGDHSSLEKQVWWDDPIQIKTAQSTGGGKLVLLKRIAAPQQALDSELPRVLESGE